MWLHNCPHGRWDCLPSRCLRAGICVLMSFLLHSVQVRARKVVGDLLGQLVPPQGVCPPGLPIHGQGVGDEAAD